MAHVRVLDHSPFVIKRPSLLLAAAFVAPIWSLAYGLLALSWVLGRPGYPFAEAVDPDARLTLLGGIPASLGAGGLATVALLGALAGGPMLLGRGRGLGRRLAVAVGVVTAITFAILLPDLRVLVVTAYTPILLAGAPFGWPPGASLAREVTWPFVHQLVVMVGGILWAGATVRYRRVTAGACERCGRIGGARAGDARTGDTVAGSNDAWAGRWGRRGVAVAVVIPLIYVTTRWAWALDIPLGMSAEGLRDYQGMQRVGGVSLASVAALGALLTTGLVASWGEVVPRWIPVLGGRRVPIGLAVVPASVMTVVITSAGVSFVRGVLVGAMPFELANWGVVGPTLLWSVWGVALGIATLAYAYRRRGRCPSCGRGPG